MLDYIGMSSSVEIDDDNDDNEDCDENATINSLQSAIVDETELEVGERRESQARNQP